MFSPSRETADRRPSQSSVQSFLIPPTSPTLNVTSGNFVSLIVVPYHAGVPDLGVGAGPKYILQNRLVERLQAIGKIVTVHEIGPAPEFEGDIGRSFEIIRRVSEAVVHARKNRSFPIVLAGNCNVSVGVAAGLSSIEDLEVVWFDAHCDLETPEETLTGNFDSMAVSM